MNSKELKLIHRASSSLIALSVLFFTGSLISLLLLVSEYWFITPWLTIIGLVFFLIAGLAATFRPDWGRPVVFIGCLMLLLAFPVGTFFGALGIRDMINAELLFGTTRLRHSDLKNKIREESRTELKN
jgi:hypothetical protein